MIDYFFTSDVLSPFIHNTNLKKKKKSQDQITPPLFFNADLLKFKREEEI